MLTEGGKWSMPELKAAENILQKVPPKNIKIFALLIQEPTGFCTSSTGTEKSKRT